MIADQTSIRLRVLLVSFTGTIFYNLGRFANNFENFGEQEKK